MAMAYAKERVGQSRYWTIFGAYMIVTPLLLIGGLYALFTGSYGVGLAALLLMAPLGLYFRVVMMRRCRDIGWPGFLPWVLFLLPMAAGFMGGFRLGETGPGALPLMMMPLLVSLADFAFAIVIGCKAAKREDEDYARIFGDAGEPARPASPPPSLPEIYPDEPRPALAPNAGAIGEPDYSRFDAAVARALEARRSTPSDPAPAAAPPGPAPLSAHARAVAGFGRKVV